MGAIKFLLVLLLSMPVAFLILRFINVLMDNLKNQQDASEEIRIRKAAFQGSRKYDRSGRRGSDSVKKRKSRDEG